MSCYIKYNGCIVNCESYVRMYNGGLSVCKFIFFMYDRINNYWRDV